jgi:hypothetical protein
MEPAPQTPTNVMDTAEAADPAAVREVFRAKHRLAVSVMERPQQYPVAYSLADIHRLTFMSHEERTAVQNEWHAWHRKYVRLSALGFCLWLAGAAAAWALWFRSGDIAGVIQNTFGLTVPGLWFTVLAVATTFGLLMGLPAFLATTSASTQADCYLRGYTDGLTRGVNRALHITPDVEQEMWEELRQAERLDASWRRTTELGSQGSGGSTGSAGSTGSGGSTL